jgi:hypothetical protein
MFIKRTEELKIFILNYTEKNYALIILKYLSKDP